MESVKAYTSFCRPYLKTNIWIIHLRKTKCIKLREVCSTCCLLSTPLKTENSWPQSILETPKPSSPISMKLPIELSEKALRSTELCQLGLKPLETAAPNNKSKLHQGHEPQREMLEAEVTSSFILYVHSTALWLNKKPKSKNTFPFKFKVI